MLADLILRSSLRTCVPEFFFQFSREHFTCGQFQLCTYVRMGLIFSRIVFFFFYLIANVKHKRAIFQIEIRIIGIIIPGFFFFFSFLFSFFNCKRLERLRGERDRNLIVAIISRKDTYCTYLPRFLSFSFIFVSKYFPAPIIFPHFHLRTYTWMLFQNFTSYCNSLTIYYLLFTIC